MTNTALEAGLSIERGGSSSRKWPGMTREPTVREVRELHPSSRSHRYYVKPEAILKSVSESNLRPVVPVEHGQFDYGEIDDITREAIEKFKVGLEPYSKALEEVINDDDFLRNLAYVEKPRAALKQVINVQAGIDNDIARRVSTFLNTGHDPEMVVLGMHKMRQEGSLEAEWIEVIEDDQNLQDMLISMLSDQVFKDDLRQDGPDSPNCKSRIDILLKNWTGRVVDRTGEEPQLVNEKIRSGLGLVGSDQRTKCIFNKTSKVIDDSGRIIEYSFPDPCGRERYSLFGKNSPVIEIQEMAQIIERGKYLVSLKQLMEGIYETHFGILTQDTDATLVKNIALEHSLESSPTSTNPATCSNGSWQWETNTMRLKMGKIMKGFGPDIFDEDNAWVFEGEGGRVELEGKRKVVDTTVVAHEYAHAIFQNLIFTKKGVKLSKVEDDRIMRPLDEGFAVLMEHLVIDVLTESPELLDFNEQDLTVLKERKRYRGKLLKTSGKRDVYTEGFAGIIWHIYLEGARSNGKLDKLKGFKKVIEFLNNINPQKILEEKRFDKRYRDIVDRKKRTKEDWSAFVEEMKEFVE